MSTFKLDVSKFIDKTSKTVDAEVRKICLDLLTGIVLKTPVDTGRARANWFTSIGSPSSSTINFTGDTGRGISAPNRSAASAEAISRGSSVIAKATGNVLWITNNLPYIYRLEFEGWSRQAPAGMVRVTVNDIARQLR
jgi:hypothetical protein